MKRKHFVAVGLALTKLGLFEVRGTEADRLHEGVSTYVGVNMFVLNCLQIWGERELVCVLMWIPWVALIIVFSSR